MTTVVKILHQKKEKFKLQRLFNEPLKKENVGKKLLKTFQNVNSISTV